MKRREFLRDSITIGLGLVLSANTPGLFAQQKPPKDVSLDSLVQRLSRDKSVLNTGLAPEQIHGFFTGFKEDSRVPAKFSNNPELKGKKGELTYEGFTDDKGKYIKGYWDILGVGNLIVQGPNFYKKYQSDIEIAEEKYNIPAKYIAAIIGVESSYGRRKKGSYNAFQALTTAYLKAPGTLKQIELADGTKRWIYSRREWAYYELKHLLMFAEKNSKDPREYTSSYAGAIGVGQFIPSSLNRYFVGKNGDFKADPYDITDMIYSVAYYLLQKGWNPEEKDKEPVHDSDNWKAIYAYNNSDFYVRAVVEIAENTKWKSLITELGQGRVNFKNKTGFLVL